MLECYSMQECYIMLGVLHDAQKQMQHGSMHPRLTSLCFQQARAV